MGSIRAGANGGYIVFAVVALLSIVFFGVILCIGAGVSLAGGEYGSAVIALGGLVLLVSLLCCVWSQLDG